MTVPVSLDAPHKALTMLVHGPSKVGKSLLAASLPKPLLYLDVESASRHLPLRSIVWNPINPPPEADLKKWDTCVVHVRRWQDVLDALVYLSAGMHPFKGISVDSISELQYRSLEHISGRGQMKIQDWGTVLREVGGFVRDLRDLTMHETKPVSAVLITAMTQEREGFSRPYLQGQMKDQIPYLLDVTGYLYIDQYDGKRYLRTRRSARVEAGERVNGRIPELLEMPDVSGETAADVAKVNKTFQQMMKLVFAAGPAITAPPPPDEAPVQTEVNGEEVPMSTAASALAAEQGVTVG